MWKTGLLYARNFLTLLLNIVARTWRLYKMGYWIDNWVYWITHSYSVHTLQLTTVDHNTRLATVLQPVFHCTVSSRLSLYSSGPRTSCRPTHCLRTPSSLTHGNSAASAGSVCSHAGTYQPPNHDWTKTVFTASLSYIAWDRTRKKTPTVTLAHCCMSSRYQVTSPQACSMHVTIFWDLLKTSNTNTYVHTSRYILSLLYI
jgi:hypothetical protein